MGPLRLWLYINLVHRAPCRILPNFFIVCWAIFRIKPSDSLGDELGAYTIENCAFSGETPKI